MRRWPPKLRIRRMKMVLPKGLIVGLLVLAASSAMAAGPGPYDGSWSGQLGDKDTGNCEGVGAKPTYTLTVKEGKAEMNFETQRGQLPLSGGFSQDGALRVSGSSRMLGESSLEGKASGDTLSGRWHFKMELPRRGIISCAGPFTFKKT